MHYQVSGGYRSYIRAPERGKTTDDRVGKKTPPQLETVMKETNTKKVQGREGRCASSKTKLHTMIENCASA